LGWSWIADQRFNYLDARTGFLSLGPWVKSDCGTDLRVETRWERMKDVYVMVRLPSPLHPIPYCKQKEKS
jgi:hypothetical protein